MRRYNLVTSSVGLLSTFFTASKVAGQNGPFSIVVSPPLNCTSSSFTYSSAMAMATGSFVIDPGSYGMGQPGQKWTFTVSPGIVLDNDTWGDDGQHIDSSIVQNASGSYIFTVPTANWLAGPITGEANAPGCDPNQPGSPVLPYVPTQSASSIVQIDASASCVTSSASFTLTVSATLPCDATTSPTATSTVLPVPCTDNYIPPLTTEQWEAQAIDDFWQMYYDNTSHWQDLGLMKTFFQDFAGGEPGDGVDYACSATNEVDCSFLESCSLVATGPESWLTPYKTQAYYIWAGMTNFSKMMNMIWQALEWAAQDMNYYAGEVGAKFEVKLPGASLWSKVFPILNTILTLLAIVFIVTDPFVAAALAPEVGILIGLAASFGLAADVDTFLSSSEQSEVTIETIYSDLGFSDGWIQFLQDQVSFMHDSMWINGTYSGNGTASPTDAKKLMKGGAYVASSQVIANADLNTTDRSAPNGVGPTNAVTAWFENLLVANLINNWFKSNNAYIVYIPYGPVLGLNLQNSLETFTEDDCNSQWIAGTNPSFGADWNKTVVVNCDNGGMAVLMNGGSSVEKPSFYEVANMTYNGITYSPHDMITSSVNGFLQYGFNYNATDSFVAKLLDPTAENLSNITQYLHLDPTSPGMYNLPVCRLYDLAAVPNSIQGPWPKGQTPSWPSQTQPCTCMSDNANITINGNTTYFRDFAGQGVTTQLNTLIKGSTRFGDTAIADSTCYVAGKGDDDCTDFPSLCYVPFPPF